MTIYFYIYRQESADLPIPEITITGSDFLILDNPLMNLVITTITNGIVKPNV